ncbi:MAG TPA: DUF1285 domain-containing protein [Syntrophomonadaceae bacterium]|nr:DUF1285 domain-containing protein [Syntrophomonadaceae bacterium]
MDEFKDITIRKNGKWYFGQGEMFRRKILNILAVNLDRQDDGSYCIRLGNDFSLISVEDVPFLASGIVEGEDGSIKLVFHDLQELMLENELKLTLKGDVPYIDFRWPADTRLSRGVYWKLSDYFVFRDDEIYIVPPVKQEKN